MIIIYFNKFKGVTMKKILITLLFSLFFLTTNNIAYAKSCSSDFSCGTGSACVKEPFKTRGVCMKTTNSYGVRTYNAPSTSSIGSKTSGSCTFNTDCPTRYKCDRRYKECVKR